MKAVELAVEPSYEVRQQVFEGLPWATVLSDGDDVDAVLGDGYSVSLFTDYSGDRVAQV